MERIGDSHRKSRETEVAVQINLECKSIIDIQTGIGFFDHMLTLLSSHGEFGLQVSCRGDLEVDGHHSVEDIGIVMGKAFKKALGDRKGINRYGTVFLPMDESLTMISLDISGRPYLHLEHPPLSPYIGDFHTELLEEFLRSFSNHCGLTLHVKVLYGRSTHHMIEGVFKGLGRALKQAISRTSSSLTKNEIPSTKGILD